VETLELIRITDTNAETAQATELGQEYTDWLVAASAEEHDREVPSHAVTHIPHHTEDGELILDDPGHLYLGVADGQPVAIGLLKPVTQTLCEGKRLYVRPEFRGRGFGRQMLERLIADASEIGYTHMRAEVSLLMREVIALYNSYDNVNEQMSMRGTTQHQMFLTYDIPAPGSAPVRKS